MVPLPDDNMLIEYDEELGSYYIVWNPIAAVGLGKTEKEALEELRQAAHFGIDAAVNIKLAEIHRKETENGKQG
jgi:predicted RNase H-like HicB family nuclease